MDTSIVNSMTLAEEKTTLDKHVINLFTHKSILALLMKYCVQEFSSFTPKQIMEECIVGEPAVRKIAVHRDEPDAPGVPSFPAADLAEDMLDGMNASRALTRLTRLSVKVQRSTILSSRPKCR